MNRDRRTLRALCSPLLAALILLVSAAVAQAATITVTTRSDAGTGAGDCLSADTACSLRQAITAEDGTPSGGDTIVLGSGTYSLTQGTNLLITEPTSIQGAGVAVTSIDGSQNNGGSGYNGLHRILKVNPGISAVIQDLTLTGGYDNNDENFCGGCAYVGENGGGALFNDGGTVTLSNVAFTNDPGGVAPGAAIGNLGQLTLSNVSFTNDGPQALFTKAGTINGTGITFENDGTGCCGGNGGAAYLYGGVVTLVNTTVVGSGGAASIAGGIDNADATLTLTNDTLSGDIRGSLQTDAGGATTNVENTIFGVGSFGSDCVASGQLDTLDNGTAAAAITNDLGHNIDQDGTCNLSATGDDSGVDPKLASIADNTGPTRTQALVFGSPALGDPGGSGCPSIDQRGVQRPEGHCDIGAFEAQVSGKQPSATTGPAQNVQQTQADLEAQVNFAGEPGGFHFAWGNSPANLNNVTSEVGAGELSSPTSESQTLTGLSPGMTYYYQAVADNASHSTPGATLSFTTPPGPPTVSNVRIVSVTDTTATIDFSIDPQGADTTYQIEYGPTTDYGRQTPTVDIGSTAGAQSLETTLTNLTPGTTYHFSVVAGNSVQSGVSSGDNTVTTDQQIAGVAGKPVSLSDGGTGGSCPGPTATIDWGDGSTPDQVAVTCNLGSGDQYDYSVTGSHTYTTAGHYPIQIIYPEFALDHQYALITGPPTNTTPPAIVGIAQQGQTLTANPGQWTGNPTSFDYQWQDCDASGQNCADTGTDATTYTLGSGDVGHTIIVTVTATNASGHTAASSSPTALVAALTSPPATTPGVPAASTGTPSLTITGAGFAGTVIPNGLATQAFFEYGLDPRYSGGGPVVYDHSTAAQAVGSDFSSHPVGPVPVSGLVPNAVYHVRLVATNSAGTSYGPDVTFITERTPPPGLPALGHTFNVNLVKGLVLIEVNGKFVPLTELTQIRSGSIIDARLGSLELITAGATKGKTQHGVFGGAIFRLTQERAGHSKGLVTLSIVEAAFKGAPSYALCRAHGKAGEASAAALSSKTLQLLHASAHGKFRTTGRYSAATVRGTIWTVADRCDGTLTRDITDSVVVNDFVHHKTIILHAGQSYLARAPGRHK